VTAQTIFGSNENPRFPACDSLYREILEVEALSGGYTDPCFLVAML
jgi:hypothetical protein